VTYVFVLVGVRSNQVRLIKQNSFNQITPTGANAERATTLHGLNFYARHHVALSSYYSCRNSVRQSVRPSVRLSVTVNPVGLEFLYHGRVRPSSGPDYNLLGGPMPCDNAGPFRKYSPASFINTALRPAVPIYMQHKWSCYWLV